MRALSFPRTARLSAIALGGAGLVLGTSIEPASAVGSADYTVTALSGLYEPPAVDAVPIGTGSSYAARVDLPFEFSYFGVVHDHVTVNVGSLMLFGNDTGSVQTNSSDPATVSSGSVVDGACAPFWCCLQLTSLPNIKKWVAGTAPNRRQIVSWEACSPYSGGPATLTFQVKLFEGSNRIEFAYKPDSVPTTWANVTYSSGMVAPGADSRWVAPVNNLTTNTGHPVNDYRFDPRNVTVSGRAMYDRLTPTAAGTGTTTTQTPLAGLELDLLYPNGTRFARGVCDANGDFQATGPAGPTGTSVDLFVYTRGSGCTVKAPAASAAFVNRIASSIANNADVNIGTVVATAGLDATAQFRGPAAVACAVQKARDWLASRTATTIPSLPVSYDFALATATGYASSPSPTLTVAGPSAGNPDTWDDAVVLRTYGRFACQVLTGVASPQTSDAFDIAGDADNAFAVAFGHFLAAAVTGQRVFVDATGTSSAVAYDLEDPQPVTPKGPDCAAWVAAALYDLTDAANEPSDTYDGSTNGADRVVQAVDALTNAPDAVEFLESWTQLGFDGPGASRLWIADGLVADDASEANDAPSESAAFGPLGTRRDGLTLNPGNEDWFDLTVPSVTDVLHAEMNFPRGQSPATVELQLLTSGGVSLADEVDAGTGPVAISANGVAAGTYRLRVVHVSGKRVPSYTLQASQRLTMDRTALKSWTTGIPYQQAIAVSGGIGTASFVVQSGTAPVGLLFDAPNQRVAGNPVQAGTFDFTLALVDSGSPQHTDLATHHVVINPALDFDLGEFLPFAMGKPTSATRPHTGGTAPLVISVASGALPADLVLAVDELVFTGTANAAGSSALTIHGVDVAGSSHDADVTAVVCIAAPAAKTPVELAAGDAACGFFFDAVEGSGVKFSVVTARKRAKRALRCVLIGPDGSPVEGASAKPGTGKTSVAAGSLPATGRYFVVVASETGDATQLLGTVGVTAPKAAKGSFDDVQGGGILVIEFGALSGAKLSFKAAPAKGVDLALNILALVGPNGVAVPLAGIASQKGTSALLATTLAQSGTWTVRVRANGGGTGTVAYSAKIAEPKGGAFSAD